MKQAKMAVVSFTPNGQAQADRIQALLKYPLNGCQWKVYTVHKPVDLKCWCKEQFETKDAIVFIGAMGIAVRTIAPFIVSKVSDPAVIVMDELALHVISVLSGHLGGGNALAAALAEALNAVPVITTASDVNGKIAIDVFAKKNKLHISSMQMAKKVASAIVSRKKVSFTCDGVVKGMIPEELSAKECDASYHIKVCPNEMQNQENVLWLIPKAYILGVGCKKGKTLKEIEIVVLEVLKERRIPIQSVAVLVSIDLKREEKGLLDFCEKYQLPAKFYSAEELLQAPGVYETSAFVKEITGVENVCERATVCRAKEENPDISKEAALVIEKTKKAGVTVALAKREWGVTFG